MSNTMLKLFDRKICKSCGQSFIGENDVCNSCNAEFDIIASCLRQDEHSNYLKFCKYCGRPFLGGYISTRKSTKFFQPTRGEYCKGIDGKGTHYSQCQECGSTVKDTTSNGNWPTKAACSRKCKNIIKQKRTAETCIERYGVPSPLHSKDIRDKGRQTTFERYGVHNYLEKGVTRDIADASMREKYQVESNISQNREIRKKIDTTVTEKYGGYTWASPELSARCKETSLERYGVEYPTQSDEIKERRKETTRKIYGVDNVMQSSVALQSMQRNSREKYGVDWPAQIPEVIEARRRKIIMNHANSIKDPLKRQNYLLFCNDRENFITSFFDHKPTIRELSESLGNLDESTIYYHLGPEMGSKLLSRAYSYMELEVSSFISSIMPGIVIEEDCRRILPGRKEIDIYLPDYKIGFECNPTSTHNSTLPYRNIEGNICTSSYHKDKTDLSESANIFLFHIFGYEWALKQDIIKSMIANLLRVYKNKYYARNLHVKEISDSECRDFLNHNHRQGATTSKIRLGLYTIDNQLVSVMTFNKMRMSMGASKTDTANTWELSRFCNQLNTFVAGGASRLFKYFIRHYQYDKIVSFSDRAHTRGTLYETLGFHQVNISEPNYVWVDYKTDMYYNRVNCQKKNLPKLFNEPDLDIENQTEKMIMTSHGFVQVFDSGTIRWEYTD